jgi:hypothetical protein
MTHAELEKYFDNIVAPAIGEALGQAMAELEQRFAKRLDDIARELSYKGAWQAGTRYRRGNFVALGGLWHCEKDTEARPGSDGTSWVLVIQKPRDGRDYVPPAPAERRVATAGTTR